MQLITKKLVTAEYLGCSGNEIPTEEEINEWLPADPIPVEEWLNKTEIWASVRISVAINLASSSTALDFGRFCRDRVFKVRVSPFNDEAIALAHRVEGEYFVALCSAINIGESRVREEARYIAQEMRSVISYAEHDESHPLVSAEGEWQCDTLSRLLQRQRKNETVC